MSLENSIDNLAQAIKALAEAFTNRTYIEAITEVQIPSQPTIVGPPFTSTESEATKRTRRTKEQMAAAKAAEEAAKASQQTEEVASPAELDEASPPVITYTEGDVRTALMKLRDKDGSKDRAVAILKKHTGQEVLPGAPPSTYAAIIDGCHKAMGL